MVDQLNAMPFGWVLALIAFGAVLCALAMWKGGLLQPKRNSVTSSVTFRPRPAPELTPGQTLAEQKRAADALIEKRLADLSFEQKTLQDARGKAA